jgi:hypothetical protein
MKPLSAALFCVLALVPAVASAQRITITPVVNAIAAADADAALKQSQAPPPPFVYSDGYRTRVKIHKAASMTFLPLVAAQGILGKMVYDNPTPTKRAWHRGVAWGIGGLFAVNTVTGTWNLVEARKDPQGKKRRVTHALLMLASDVGFLATAMTNPTNNGLDDPAGQRSLHRGLAIASISTATVGYLVMLLK